MNNPSDSVKTYTLLSIDETSQLPTTSKRAINFSAAEKNFLIELVSVNPDAVSKKTDKSSLQKKNKAWSRITEDLNASGLGGIRTTEQVKNCWKNQTKKTKSVFAAFKREQRKTGGGTPEIKIDDVSDRIYGLIPQQIDDIANIYDDDHVANIEDKGTMKCTIASEKKTVGSTQSFIRNTGEAANPHCIGHEDTTGSSNAVVMTSLSTEMDKDEPEIIFNDGSSG